MPREASKAATIRLTREYKQLQKSPIDLIKTHPSESNILEWHFLMDGPPDSVYSGGIYHGVLTFPSDYPFNPPSIRVITPSGRFVPNSKICLSISDFHKETWNPAWSVGSILVGLLSYMTSTENSVGTIQTSNESKISHSKQSKYWNVHCNERFKIQFPSEYTILHEAIEKDDQEILSRLITKDYDTCEKNILDQNGNVIETIRLDVSDTSNDGGSSRSTTTIDADDNNDWLNYSDNEGEIIEFETDDESEVGETKESEALQEKKFISGNCKENPIDVDSYRDDEFDVVEIDNR